MALLPATANFLEPSTYVRYWDIVEHRYKFMRLVMRDFPLVYPRRLGSVSPGGKTALLQLRELEPSERSKHRYMAYIGVHPGALYYLRHPIEHEQLRWDESIREIDRDQTGWFSYEESPYDAPTKVIWIQPQQFPGLEAINIRPINNIPEILIVAAKYLVQEEGDLSPIVVQRLNEGDLSSIQISFGGDW